MKKKKENVFQKAKLRKRVTNTNNEDSRLVKKLWRYMENLTGSTFVNDAIGDFGDNLLTSFALSYFSCFIVGILKYPPPLYPNSMSFLSHYLSAIFHLFISLSHESK